MPFVIAVAVFFAVLWTTGHYFPAALAAWFMFGVCSPDDDSSEAKTGGGEQAGSDACSDQPMDVPCYGIATFRMLGYVAKADGRVARTEVSVAESVMKEMGCDADQRRMAIAAFNEGKESADLHGLVASLVEATANDPDIKRMTMDALVRMAAADGNLSKSEETALRLLHSALMPISYSIEDAMSHIKDSPYSILGLTPPADLQTIKKAYRAKCRDFHPDHLDQKKLPPELKLFARERMNKIQNAYEQLTAQVT